MPWSRWFKYSVIHLRNMRRSFSKVASKFHHFRVRNSIIGKGSFNKNQDLVKTPEFMVSPLFISKPWDDHFLKVSAKSKHFWARHKIMSLGLSLTWNKFWTNNFLISGFRGLKVIFSPFIGSNYFISYTLLWSLTAIFNFHRWITNTGRWLLVEEL